MLIKEKGQDQERVSFYNESKFQVDEDDEALYRREIPKYLRVLKQKAEKRSVTKIQLSKSTERQK